MEQIFELMEKNWNLRGVAGLRFARRHREVLRGAGFGRIEASASVSCSGTPEATRSWGETVSRYIMEPESQFRKGVIDKGWADLATLETMATDWRRWGEHPDAFWAQTWCEAVGWKE